MRGLDPRIHIDIKHSCEELFVDGRIKCGHDDSWSVCAGEASAA